MIIRPQGTRVRVEGGKSQAVSGESFAAPPEVEPDQLLTLWSHFRSVQWSPKKCLQTAGLLWEDNGRRDTPLRLKYSATGPRGRQWSIRPVPPPDFDPWQPSSLWRAVCAAPRGQSTVMSAQAPADHIREFIA